MLCLPLARFSPRGLATWRGFSVVLALYAYLVETVQIARGLDPRFSKVAPVRDQVLGGVFFLTALGLIALFAVLAWKILRRRMDGANWRPVF